MRRGLRRTSPAAQLVESGFVVPDYYAAQARQDFDQPRDAAEHYLETGCARGLLPNPVHDFEGLPLPGAEEVGREDFESSTALLPVRPHVDLAAYGRLVPAAYRHPGGAAGHFLHSAAAGELASRLAAFDGGLRTWLQVLKKSARLSSVLDAILDSAQFDQELYEAQVGCSFASAESAVWHYLERGETRGLLPHAAFQRSLRLTASGRARGFAAALEDERLATTAGAREKILQQARLIRAAEVLAEPSAVPTPGASRQFARDEPAHPSDRQVTIVARATQITLGGVRAVTTLSKQTHTAWELVLGLDPKAPKRVRAHVARIAARDERIRVVDVEDAVGTAEVLAEDAQGDLVALWDGTEQWAPRFLELAVATLGTGPAVLAAVAHDTAVSRPDPLTRHDGRVDTAEQLAWSRPRGLRGALVRRTLLDAGPDPLQGVLGGWELLLRARQDGPIGYVPMIAVAGPEPAPPALGDVARVRARSLPSVSATRTAGTTTVLVPLTTDLEAATLTILSVVDAGHEVLACVDDPARALELAARFGDRPGVHLLPLPAPTTWAHAAALAASSAHGDACLFLGVGILPAGAVELLRATLADAVVGASATLVAPDSTIAGGALVFPGRRALPHRLLAGQPIEDLPDLSDVDTAAAEAEGLLLRTSVLDDLGLDPGLDESWAMPELTSRATQAGGRLRTVSDVRLVCGRMAPLDPATAPARLRLLHADPDERAVVRMTGLDTHGVSVDGDATTHPVIVRPPRLVRAGPARGVPSLRWAIKAPMPPGPMGDPWGDTYFIDDLARALRRLGQDVVVDRNASHHRPASSHLDDVVLAVRGLVPYRPQPGTTSLLWIISHPEKIRQDELDESVDLAYAASPTWAEHATHEFGRTVHTLLQATNPARFHPDVEPDPHGIVFVGRPRRGTMRPIVGDAVRTGHTLDVYGMPWDQLIDPSHIRAEFLPNDRLPRVYRGARIVLNDHHAEMAAQGFWSNRPFDAAATGARVVSDEVVGGPEMFGGLVRTYSTVEELRQLLSPEAEGWPDPEERITIARRIGREHSFDARARRMLADVLDVRGVDHDLQDQR